MNRISKTFLLVIAAFAILTFIFSGLTGLHYDEAYYYMYSLHPAAGYFDHPPMVAFLIKAGTFLFGGEFGVRFLTSILSILTFGMLLWHLAPKGKTWLAVLFILSFPILQTHLTGMLAIPDTPLAFFTVIFLLLYRKFTEKSTFPLGLALGVTAAAMIYSKYHALLVILLVVLSNLKLLTNKHFYIAMITALILFIPHVWWQFANHFPTLKYHIVSRSSPLHLQLTAEYLGNQLIMFGPLTFFLTIPLLVKHKIQNVFERALLFNILGFLTFFFFMSFKGRVEGHWTGLISIMLIFLLFSDVESKPNYLKWFKPLATVALALTLVLRTYLAIDALPNVANLKSAFFKWEKTMNELHDIAGNEPVLVYSSYKLASLYSFYNKTEVSSLPSDFYRYSQFDFWPPVENFTGKDVRVLSGKQGIAPCFLLANEAGFETWTIPDFQDYRQCILQVDSVSFANDTLYQIAFSIENPTPFNLSIDSVVNPKIGIESDKRILQAQKLLSVCNDTIIPAKGKISGIYEFEPLGDSGKTYMLHLTFYKQLRSSVCKFTFEVEK